MPNNDIIWNLLKQYTPGGSQTLSKMPNRYVEGVYPKVLSQGKGGRVLDVDGNEFIDLISGLGAISVGYSNHDINLEVIRQLQKGITFSLPTEWEYKVAERLTKLVPGTEMWKFGKNGTDGTVYAVRAARAYTGRDKIMTVGYNGCADVFEVKGNRNAGVPKILGNLITKATYNDLGSFKDLLTQEYACVLMEPMVYDAPYEIFLDTPVNFLQEVQELCRQTGTLLIMDEVVTGGRYKNFVAHIDFKVLPDMVVLSKGIANGFPLSAVGGRRTIMETFERDDFFASGTFGGETISLAACLETLNQLEKALPTMYQYGVVIKDCFNYLFESKAICKGYPTRLTFDFPTKEHKALWMQEMCLEGVLTGYSNFIMADHTEQDVKDICMAMYKASQVLKQHWENPKEALLGKLPVDPLRMRN